MREKSTLLDYLRLNTCMSSVTTWQLPLEHKRRKKVVFCVVLPWRIGLFFFNPKAIIPITWIPLRSLKFSVWLGQCLYYILDIQKRGSKDITSLVFHNDSPTLKKICTYLCRPWLMIIRICIFGTWARVGLILYKNFSLKHDIHIKASNKYNL